MTQTTDQTVPAASGEPGATDDGPLPLSFAQERLWFFHQLQPDSTAYHQPMGLRLTGPLDVAALQRAVDTIVARHESLRTTFGVHDGRPYQHVAEPAPVELPVRELADGHREHVVRDAVRAPFDLVAGPLHRWRLYRLGDDEHLLLIVLHHMVTDGWSFGVLTTELGALYSAYRDRADSPLAELDIQYPDYALWQRETVSGAALDAQLAHWRDELAGLEPLELPTDRPRPPEQTFNGDRHWFRIPAPLSERMLELARTAGATPFMALVSVFQLLLAAYSGQDDLAVGVPVAGRDRPELTGLVGYFVNTLVLRGDLSGDPTFRELLGRTRQRAAHGYRNLDVPLQWVTAELDYRRDLSRNALFDVMFAWQDVPAAEPEMAGLRVSFDAPDTTVNLVDLALNCYPDADGILGHIIYNRDLFDPDTVERMSALFTDLLGQVVDDPDRPVSRLSPCTGADRELLDSCAVGVPVPATGTVVDLFAARVAGQPDAVAVHHGGRSTSYRELAAMVERVAGWLHDAGVAPGQVVGVCLPRGVPLLAALLGVLRSGAAYLPLDPDHPPARLAFMLADSAATVVLTVPGAARLPDGVRTATMAEVLDAPGTPPDPPTPGDLAYLIYTSGSTGTPKAVLVEHAGLAARVSWMVDEYGLTPTDRVLQFASVSFDTHVEEIYPCLVSGGQLVLTDPRSDYLPELLATPVGQQLTVLDLPTPYWHELARLVDTGQLRIPDAVRLVLIGADQADADAVRAWRAHVPARLLNTYGPTEATVVATAADLTAEPSDATGTPPIGRPVGGVRVHVLDSALRPVGVGLCGELYLGGTGVARGYLGRPGLTADRFVPDPFAGAAGQRLYRTGDRVRWRADGQLEFLGRLDHQVKVRGFRVELAEVEAALRQQPGVADAAVTVFDEPARRLVGYLVAADGAAAGHALDTDAVRAGLAERLPEYMLPAELVVLPSLPRTAAGKPDRRALPRPESTRRSRPPRGEREQALAEVWCEVLRLDSVGAEDNFFELGGDSIISIQVVARARARGVPITPRQMFRHQTIAELAAAGTTAPRRADSGPVSGSVALLPMQRWFFSRPWGNRTYFTQSVLVSVPAGIEPELLASAVRDLVERHPALRAGFRPGEDGWTQHVAAPGEYAPLDCRQVDLSVLPAEQRAAALTAECVALKGNFTLEQPPLLRAGLFTVDDAAPRQLLLVAHHLAVDAVSWHILLEDLADGYRRLSAGQPPAPPAPTGSIRDQADLLSRYADSDELRRERDFWSGQTAGAASGASNGTWGTGRSISVELDEEHTRALLTGASRVPGSRTTDVLLAALATAWRRWSGEPELAVDLEGHGRDELAGGVELDRTVGWFTALYPVRLACPDPADPAATLRGVRDVLRRVPRGGIGFGVLRYLRGELADLPVPPVSLNYLGRFDPAGADGGSGPDGPMFGPSTYDSGPDTALDGDREHRIEINGGVFDGRLRMTFGFSPQRDPAESVRRLADDWAALVADYATGSVGPVDAAGPDDVLGHDAPLSPLQQGLLFHALAGDQNIGGEYVVQVQLRLTGPLRTDLVRRVWQELADRYEVLRSTVRWRDVDEPVQLVHPHRDIPVTEIDAGQRWDDWLAADRHAGFDLAAGPLLRVALLRHSAQRHTMVVTNHHIILDGWSSTRLLDTFLTAYRRAAADQPSAIEPVRPFADYLTWLAAQDQDAARAYWQRRLAGFTRPTTISDDPPSDAGAPDPVDLVVTLPAADTARLVASARREHLTMSTLLHTAWAVVLGRHAGSDDVVFGSTVSGRPAELDGVESMLGLFINTLPVRLTLPHDRPARAVLHRTQDELTELRDVEYSSLAEVQRLVGLAPGRRLFDSILVVENYPAPAGGGPDGELRVEQVATSERTSYPLTVAVTVGEQLLVRLSYRPDRWDGQRARWLVDQLLTALTSLAERPDLPIGDTPVLTDDERHVLSGVAGPAHPAPPLAELVARQARRTPDAPAVTFGSQTLSYAELDERAGTLAYRLRALGVGPDRVVAVCVDRSIELVVALLAVLRAGGAYLPLDPGYPSRRLAYMLADSGTGLLLCDAGRRSLAEEVAGDGVRVVPLSEHTGPHAIDPLPVVGADNLAYVIYTSGSTGTPKGVANTHRGIGNRLLWMQQTYRLTADDVVLQKTPSSFDVSVWEFFWPLISGARLVLARPDGHRDPAYLADLVARERVTTMHFVPSMLRAFLDQPDRPDCPDLRQVLCSGEELPAPLARQAVQALDVDLHNLYGPTEAAVDVTAWHYRPEADTTGVPIGRPIDGIQVRVLDRWQRPVPVGAAGEVYLGGVGLARGYLGRPALTADRFVPDPYGAPGARLYRTGDVARHRTDGAVEFLGRADDQVKLRGFRIELGEVETRLVEHPGVRAAAVAVRPDAAGSGRLVGYLVPRDTMPENAQLREFLAETLPEYMVPNVFVELAGLPLTPSGKLDRTALPEPTRAARPARRAPSGATEQILAGIWQQVLDVPDVGADDDFFDLGGHSLLAMRVIARATRELPPGGVALGVMDLFTHPTIAGLAALADGTGTRSDALLHRMTPPRGTVQASLICVPYGGGSAAGFKPLADALDTGHALYAVALPGHDPGRPDEQLCALPEVVRRCADEIADTVDGPLIVYGHCLGGSATAVALAQELERRGRQVRAVYVGGAFPSAKLPGRLFRALGRLLPTGRLTGDRSYYNFVRSLGGLTGPLPDDQMHLLARALRHDSRQAEEFFAGEYTGQGASHRLRAPVISVVVDRDPTTDLYQERYREWLHFSERVGLVVLPGADHFFVRGQASELAGIVTADRAAPTGHDGGPVPDPNPSTVDESATALGEPSRLASLRRFTAVTAGELVSQIGSGLTGFALGLWVYLTTGSLTEFALVEMFATLPGVLLTPLVGAVVDRSSRRRVMALANTVAGLGQGALALLAWRGDLHLAAIYLLLSLVSLAMMFERVAYLSAIPQLAPKRYAFRLNGIVQVAMGLAQVIAPLLAVAVLHTFHITGVLAIDAVSFGAVTVVLVAVRFPATLPGLRRESLREEIARGFRYVRERRGLRDLLVYFAGLSVLTAPVFLLVTPLVLPFRAVGTIGGLLMVAGVGSIVGGLLISLWGGPQRVMAGVLGSSVLGGAAIALVGLRPSVPLIGGALFVYLLSAAIFQGCYATMVQLRVPPLLQGRVFAFVQMVSLGAAPLAYLAAGPLGERVFEPLMAPGGALAGTVGAVLGTGAGRGTALMYVLSGLAIVALTLIARRRPALWNLETALPEEPERPDPTGRAEPERPAPAGREEGERRV